jgi:hypothetical protein
MSERKIPYAVRHHLQKLLPRIGIVAGHGRLVQLVHHGLDHAVQKLFPAGHIAVERHGFDA